MPKLSPADYQSIHESFAATVAAYPDRPFLNVLPETAEIYGIDAGEITYAAMNEKIEQKRQAYRAAGFGPGHRVGLLLESRPAFFEHWFALNAEGVSVVPINPELRQAEQEYLIGHSEMVMIVAIPARQEELCLAAASAPHDVPVIGPDDIIPAISIKAQPWDGALGDWEAALLYTSGTTGLPKGCVLSNIYFVQSGIQYLGYGGYTAMTEDGERMLTPLPLFHMNAMAASTMVMIMLGGCLTFLDRFHPRSWWASVRESRATAIHYLGVMPAMLMSLPESPEDRDHQVRFGFGAGVDRLLHVPFEERFGFPLIEAWGMTETGNRGAIIASHEPRHVGTNCFGKPGDSVEVRIVDEQGKDVEPGQPGELLARSRHENPRFAFFDRYLKNEEATAEAWEGGWFHTGDIVSRNEDGTMVFVDRKKNVIRRSGENIAAVEVEVTLNRHPAIRSTAVAAVPDPVRGDEVFGMIVLDGDIPADPQALAEEITAWALGQLAYYKPPGYIAFVKELPLTPTNKIKRGDLKNEVMALFESGNFVDVRALKKRQTAK
jgi:acyl-CoA synthetase (AMP-forming)/AMP-acid ligase II